jgi:hypothetical protein
MGDSAWLVVVVIGGILFALGRRWYRQRITAKDAFRR